MQREYAFINLFTGGNLFPEYANTEAGKTFELHLLCLAAKNFKYLHLTQSYFSKPIDVFSEVVLYYTHAHSWSFDFLRYLSGIFIGQPCWWRPCMLSSRMTRISASVKWEQVYKYISALCHKSVWERHIRQGARSERSSNYLQLWHIIIHCMACHSDCHNAQQSACTLSVLYSIERGCRSTGHSGKIPL